MDILNEFRIFFWEIVFLVLRSWGKDFVLKIFVCGRWAGWGWGGGI